MKFLWFKNNKDAATLLQNDTEHKVQEHLDIKKLDESLQELQRSATLVSTEAIEAANYLERELELTKYRFFSVIDSMIDMVIIKNADYEWVTSNAYTNKIFKLELKDYYKKVNYQISKLDWLHEEEFKLDSESDELAWASKESVTLVQQYTIGDEVRYFDIIKTPTYYDDERTQRKELIIIGRDITRLRNSQAYSNILTNALNYASDMILIINPLGEIIYCNESFSRVYGYQSEEILGTPINILKSGQCSESLYREIWDTVTCNKAWEGELINKTKTGELIDIKLNIIPIMNGLPTPINYICVMKVK